MKNKTKYVSYVEKQKIEPILNSLISLSSNHLPLDIKDSPYLNLLKEGEFEIFKSLVEKRKISQQDFQKIMETSLNLAEKLIEEYLFIRNSIFFQKFQEAYYFLKKQTNEERELEREKRIFLNVSLI